MQVFHCSEDAKTSSYCSLRIIFMCLGIPKVHEKPIPKQLGDMPIVTLDDLGTDPLVCTHHIPVLFGVELRREFGGIDQITEHHRELPSFRVGRRWCSRERCSLR